MRKHVRYFLLTLCLTLCMYARASVFGKVEGLVHDPHHRPVANAQVTLQADRSNLSFSVQTDRDGQFVFTAVPLGVYSVHISQQGFAQVQQTITVASNSSAILHFILSVASVEQSTTVQAEARDANPNSVTTTTLISRSDIANTPGADRTKSLQMITNYVPGAYMTHDMLHMRGGHQVSWLIDGVQIPNTNIGSNVGPQIDPKDIDYIEVQRGSYRADQGDRTYGMFNIAPRTGFERDRQGEFVTSFGSYFQTNSQINFGDHSEKLAWFASLNGNRSNYGLEAPIPQIYHDAQNGYGGFASLIYNRDPQDQFRLVTQLRTDYFQIPYDPDQDDWQNQAYNSSGLRDGQHETDGFAAFSWVHTFGISTLLQVSPFYHYNSADYEPNANDQPVATTSDRASHYAGLQASFSTEIARNTFQAGIYGFGQHDSNLFGAAFYKDNTQNFSESENGNAGLIETFIEDNYKPTSWLTLIGGMRQSHFQSDITDNAIYPRIGFAIQVPKLDWVFRAFYGHFYQPPPLITVGGPIIQYASSQNTSFVPLRGERDEEYQFGVQIPVHGWMLDADTFQTRVNNFLDHSNIGESSIYFPVTIDGALIQAWELTLRSPRLWRSAQAHLAYSNQIARQRGAITGGLICDPASGGCDNSFDYSPVDHDQRNTLNVGFDSSLPWRAFGSANVYYGSGFVNGDPNEQFPNDYLPQHTTFDVSLGKQFGESTSVSVTALNAANRRVLIDNSVTFGGFHYNDPREIYGEVRYRFHF